MGVRLLVIRITTIVGMGVEWAYVVNYGPERVERQAWLKNLES